MKNNAFKNQFDKTYKRFSNEDKEMRRINSEYDALFKEEKPLSVICASIFIFDYVITKIFRIDNGPLWIIILILGIVPLIIRIGKDIRMRKKNHVPYKKTRIRLIDKTMGRMFAREGFYDRKPIDRIVFVDAFDVRYKDNTWTRVLINGELLYNHIVGVVAGVVGVAIDNYLFPQVGDVQFTKHFLVYFAVSNFVKVIFAFQKMDYDLHHYKMVTKDYRDWILAGKASI